jgi:putative ABC transport system permease protein
MSGGTWAPTVVRGRVPGGSGEILLSQQAVDDLGLDLGETLKLHHPMLVSATEVAMISSDVVVVGIHASPLRFTTYMDTTGATLLGMAGLANRATVVPAAGADAAALQSALFGMPGVVSAQPIDAAIRTFRDLMSMFTEILGVFSIVALALTLLVAYNSATITQDERTRETATMLAFGLPARRVMGSAMVESGLIGVIGTVLGMLGGAIALYWLTYTLVPQTTPDFGLDPSVAPVTLLLAVAMGVVVVALAPLLTWRRLARMDLPSTLRVVE